MFHRLGLQPASSALHGPFRPAHLSAPYPSNWPQTTAYQCATEETPAEKTIEAQRERVAGCTWYSAVQQQAAWSLPSPAARHGSYSVSLVRIPSRPCQTTVRGGRERPRPALIGRERCPPDPSRGSGGNSESTQRPSVCPAHVNVESAASSSTPSSRDTGTIVGVNGAAWPGEAATPEPSKG